MNAIVEARPARSVLVAMSGRYGMEPAAFEATVRATCMKPDKNGRVPTREEFAAFLLVAKEYGLNPLTKEIYAFADKGGVQPIVSIDGWMRMINDHPAFDGMEFVDQADDGGKLYAVECRIYRKDRSRATAVIEYMAECRRDTDPWRKWPARMLRHKAAIQCARYAFGFSGIMEPDEYERMKDVTPESGRPSLAERLSGPRSAEGFDPAHVQRETESVVDHDADTGEIIEPEIGSAEDGHSSAAVEAPEEQPGTPSDSPSGAQDFSDEPADDGGSAETAVPEGLQAFLDDLAACSTEAEVSALRDRYAADINKLGREVAKTARQAQAARLNEIAGGAK